MAQSTQDRPNDIGAPTEVVAGITPPKLISSVDAEFSEEARRKRVGGETTLELVVGKDGMPRRVRVTKSAAEGQKPKLQKAAATLDARALDAVLQYRFQPATREGEPVAVLIHIVVAFHIMR